MNLNTVRVFVRDIVSAKRFYGEALGLRISADGSEHGYCVFEAGAATLVVEAVPSDATPADLDLVGRFTGLSFEVPSAHHCIWRLTFPRGDVHGGAGEAVLGRHTGNLQRSIGQRTADL